MCGPARASWRGWSDHRRGWSDRWHKPRELRGRLKDKQYVRHRRRRRYRICATRSLRPILPLRGTGHDRGESGDALRAGVCRCGDIRVLRGQRRNGVIGRRKLSCQRRILAGQRCILGVLGNSLGLQRCDSCSIRSGVGHNLLGVRYGRGLGEKEETGEQQ